MWRWTTGRGWPMSSCCPTNTATPPGGFVRRALAWFRARGVRVRRVLTDNGSCYRSCGFRATCRALRLAHQRTRPYTPRTNGKAERFIQTLLREWAYARPYCTSAPAPCQSRRPATHESLPGGNNVMLVHS